MRYFTLKQNFVLRGWSDLKYGVLDLTCTTTRKKVARLTKRQFEAMELITAKGISPDEKILPDSIREMTDYALKMGFLEPCGKPKGLEDYQKYHYSKARYTHTLLWSVTGNCNLKCRHCYLSSGTNCYGELSLEQCDEVIRQCREANVNMVALTGGEPLVRKDFWQIVDRLLENHIQILQVFTNGMAVNEKFMDEFDRRKIHPNYFIVSFDGVNCHDWLRGVEGSQERVIEAIKLIKRRGYKISVVTSLHMGNLTSFIDTYELMKELGVDHWKASPIMDTGNWTKQEQRAMDVDQIYQEYLKLIKIYQEDHMPIHISLGGFFRGYSDKKSYEIPFISGCGDSSRCSQTLCEPTWIFPYLLPDGRVLPCISMSGSEMEKIAPNIFDEGLSLEKALSESLIDTYIRYTYQDLFDHNPECAACEHRYRCQGCRANALANGGYFEKDPLACCFLKGGYADKIKDIIGEKYK